jgi:uncharacterized protein YndB with AHSA1/START domain
MSGSLLLIVAVSSVSLGAAAVDAPADLMSGKVDTGRTIQLQATVDAPPAAVFVLWTTEEGLQRFLAPKAVVEPRLGGRYEIMFIPEADPRGESHGTGGARILRFEPARALSFEWFTFVSRDLSHMAPPGAASPPLVPAAERNVRPIPTWVDVTFEPVAGEPGKTDVRLAHRGFLAGGPWDEAFRYFWRAWAVVLGRLGGVCAQEARPRLD